MKIERTAVLNVIVMLAILTLQISPACAFNNGSASSLIEICTADGTVEYVAANDGQSTSKQQHTIKQECGFCFTHASQSSAILGQANHMQAVVPNGQYILLGRGSLVYKNYNAQNYQTRAPPALKA